MDKKPQALWAKHLTRAAIEYFTERQTKACLILNNLILKDEVLSRYDAVSDDFIVCVAPGYTTQLDFGDTDLTVAVRFDDCGHVMVIPYHAIRAVTLAHARSIISDEGHLNIITIPTTIYPPWSKFRDPEEMTEKARIAMMDSLLEIQPPQRELSRAAHRGR